MVYSAQMTTAWPAALEIPDPTIYPVDDDLGEGSLQRFISELLRPLLERWLMEKGTPTFVGADQYFYWKQFDAHECVAPDVYVLPGAPLGAKVDSWLVWKTGFIPSFAFEVVTGDVQKDYLRTPPRYARLGVKELVVFDPEWRSRRDRYRWQVFRQVKGRGLIRVEATNVDRIKSRTLGCWLRAVGKGKDLRVRIATGAAGEALFPTEAERAEREASERARIEAERARIEADHARIEADHARTLAALEAERAARAEVEQELAKLRAQLKKKRR